MIQDNPEEYWERRKAATKHISKDAKDLLLSMLKYDPQTRPTVNEILNCKWLQGTPMKHAEAQ